MPSLKLRDYSGGINRGLRDDLIADNEAVDCCNFNISIPGQLNQAEQFNLLYPKVSYTYDYPRDIIGFTCFTARDRGILIATKDFLYFGDVIKHGEYFFYKWTLIYDFKKPISKVSFTTTDKFIVVSTPENYPVKFNLKTYKVTKMGMKKPDKPTCELSGPGVLKGEYRYQVTFFNKKTFFESSASFDSDVIVANNNAIKVHIPICTEEDVAEDPTEIWRKVYRIGGTLTEWYLVATIENNTSQWIIDNTADKDLKVLFLEVENDPPPRFLVTAQHSGRLIGVVAGETLPTNNPWKDMKNLVVLSNVGEIEGFRYDDDKGIYKDMYIIGDSSPIKSLVIFQDNIFIFKDDSIYQMLIGEGDEGVAAVREITDKVGTISHHTTFVSENVLGTIDNNGVYVYDGSAFVRISDKISPVFKRKDFNEKNIFSIFHDRKLYISIPTDKDERNFLLPIRNISKDVINDVNRLYDFLLNIKREILVYDFKNNAWSSLPYNATQFSSYKDTLVSDFCKGNLVFLTEDQLVTERYDVVYSEGTATFTNGSREVVGINTAWLDAKSVYVLFIRKAGSNKYYEIDSIEDDTVLYLKEEYAEETSTAEYEICTRDYDIKLYQNFRYLNNREFVNDNVFYIKVEKIEKNGISRYVDTLKSPMIYFTKSIDMGERLVYKKLRSFELFGSRNEKLYIVFILTDIYYDIYELKELSLERKKFTFPDINFRDIKIGFVGIADTLHIEDINIDFSLQSPKYRKTMPGLAIDLENEEIMKNYPKGFKELVKKGLIVFPPPGGWRWNLEGLGR